MIVTVLHNQSLLDIAIQHTGSVANVFLIAQANGLAVSDEITPGDELIVPDTVVLDTDIKTYYTSRAIQPATTITEQIAEIVKQRGIGYMQIGRTFKVN